MEHVQKLREARAKAVLAMRAILDLGVKEDRDLTEAEAAEYDKLKAACATLAGQIARLEGQAQIEAEQQAVTPARATAARLPAPPGPSAPQAFESLGEFLHAVTYRPTDPRLQWAASAGADVTAEQRMDTGSLGGFAVPTQFLPTLLEVAPSEAAIRPRARVIAAGDPPDAAITMPALDQTGTNPANTYGGVEVTWIAEGATKPETAAAFREITLQPKEVAAHIVVTDKLLRNWAAASAVLENLLRGARVSAEEHAFLTGNGVGRPLGLVNSGAAYLVNRVTSTEVNLPDVQAMAARLLMRGGSPIWLASQSIIPQLLTLRNAIGSPPVGDGSLVWAPNARDTANNQMLMGYPIIWHERSPALGTKGDLVLSDLSYYLIKDGSGPFVAASPHVHFKENKTVIKLFWNVDGQPWLTEPFTGEGGFDVSPFVVLDVPA